MEKIINWVTDVGKMSSHWITELNGVEPYSSSNVLWETNILDGRLNIIIPFLFCFYCKTKAVLCDLKINNWNKNKKY